MCKLQLETPTAYKKERVFPKIRDGSNGQYIIVNKDKNLLITIMSSENDMKNITEIFRNMI